MVRVVFIISGLSTGGAETMLLKLLEHIDRQTFQPLVVSLSDKGIIGKKIESLEIGVETLEMRGLVSGVIGLLKLFSFLREQRPDLVHTWMYHADLVGGITAFLAGARPIIWGVRNSGASLDQVKPFTRKIIKICAAFSKLLPDKILCCSQRAQSEHIKLGYDPTKIITIPNGFDLHRFTPDLAIRQAVRKELGLDPLAPVIGLIARYDPQKNHTGFITMAKIVLNKNPSVHFVLAGNGVDQQNLKLSAEIAATGFPAQFCLLGKREDIPRVMNCLDFLVSSSYGEGFPNVLGEAMACGVPCVVTDVGDSAEIVGDTGRVVNAGDSIQLAENVRELLELPAEERLALGNSARDRIKTFFEIGYVVRKYEDFYLTLLGRKREQLNPKKG